MLPATSMTPTTNQLLADSGIVRLKRCKYGLMAYLPNDLYIGRSLDLYGEFSPGEASLFAQVLKPGMTALDVGANVGAHSVLFAQLVGPQGRVHAFEPQRVIYQLMTANLTLNGLFNAFPQRAAVGAEPGTLQVPPVDYSKTSNFGSLSLGGSNIGETVPIVTVDSFSLSQCHLIKADVEGMEKDVLLGAQDTIQRCRPILYVENDRKKKSADLIQCLFDLEYKLFWHISPYYKPNSFFGTRENVFGNTVSVNVLGFHKDVKVTIPDAREITDPHEFVN